MARQFLWTLLLFGVAISAHAANQQVDSYNRVSLQAQASSEVARDTLSAILSARAEGSQAARLADEVNQAINWGLSLVKAAPEVAVETHRYQTSPIYQNRTLKGWRVSQSIRLESQNAARVSELVAKLQEKLQVESINFQTSEAARRQAHDDLIGQAIDRFKARAGLITKSLGRSGFRLVRLDVNTGQTVPPPRPMMMMESRAASAVTAPTLEAGTERVAVTVTGTIEVTED